jgi:acyl carrier protein
MIEELIEAPPGSLTEHSVMADLAGWDSMAILGFINLMDEEFGLSPDPKAVVACRTIGDLADLAGGSLQD